ncbi:MAG: hypothetical protein P4N59_18190 [Negativicutes bacterium]|nr:hypothetical protein [Negativicutes bacterium]
MNVPNVLPSSTSGPTGRTTSSRKVPFPGQKKAGGTTAKQNPAQRTQKQDSVHLSSHTHVKDTYGRNNILIRKD